MEEDDTLNTWSKETSPEDKDCDLPSEEYTL